MADGPPDSLNRSRKQAGLTHEELWLRYFGLGGFQPMLELEAVLHGALVPSDHDHDVLVHALNERFSELGGDHPVPYASGP